MVLYLAGTLLVAMIVLFVAGRDRPLAGAAGTRVRPDRGDVLWLVAALG
ncbi:hypothetical protein HD597_010973 [Nonomuraea thailandensis]|uniref:Uncharacterized protein n=1 Tax=Nonomuraea thailandensis TaxID=1188745 RepID=A0A9X2K8B2_9ACTN|nr:hypothetical protein [Nonomuraea thailandensis]MCP2363953.1 hypothetical protein [Nonomuraea thailandensis]